MTVNAYMLWARGCLLMGASDYSDYLGLRLVHSRHLQAQHLNLCYLHLVLVYRYYLASNAAMK